MINRVGDSILLAALIWGALWNGPTLAGSAEAAVTSGQPLTITVNGYQFPVAVVRIRDKSQITLSSKKEFGKFPDVKLTINFGGARLTQLSGKRLHFTGGNFSEPSLMLSWKKPGNYLPDSVFISRNYEMSLAFGQERDFRIPFRIGLSSSQGIKLIATGTLLANTSDLLVVNGKVDRQQDNLDTVLYVAARFIQRHDKLPALPKLKPTGSAISLPGPATNPEPNPRRVYSSTELEFEFNGARGKETGRFQMVRDRSGWWVYRVLRPKRMRADEQVDLSLDTLFIFDYFGEQVINRMFGKDRIQAWQHKNAMLQHQHQHPDPGQGLDRTGMAAYLVTLRDGSEQYLKVLVKKQAVWKISRVLNGSQVVQAHTDKPPKRKQRGMKPPEYLSAVRLEQELNKRYPHLQIRSTKFSCRVSGLFTDCRASWYRLVRDKEQCEGTSYVYQRKDRHASWQFVRELAANERLDHRDGQVKKTATPEEYYCW